MTVKRDIPNEIKLLLRQEAGFGCCICGFPIYQYHHIKTFGSEKHHRLEDMMVLCPNHHDQATRGALSEIKQRSWKEAPFNKRRGFADGQLLIDTKFIVVEAGSNLFVGNGFKLAVDGEPLLQLATDNSGHLSISVNLYDENDSFLASIINNEWISGDPLPWDLQFKYKWLELRRKERSITLLIDASQQPVQISGELWRKKQHFSLRSDGLVFNGVISDIGLSHCGFAGLILSANTTTSRFQIVPDPILKKGKFFNWPDETTRVQYAIDQYELLIRDVN